jgi:hypothetical protein
MLSIVSVIFVSYVVSSVFDIHLFSWKGYDFFAFGILLSFIAFTERNLRFIDSALSVVFLAFLDAFFRRKTIFGAEIASFFMLYSYSFATFFLCFLAYHFTWFQKKIRLFRNVIFSLLAAISHTLIHSGFRYLAGMSIEKSFIFYSMLIMLTISFAFTLAEVGFKKLEKMWSIPERIVHEESKKESINEENDS